MMEIGVTADVLGFVRGVGGLARGRRCSWCGVRGRSDKTSRWKARLIRHRVDNMERRDSSERKESAEEDEDGKKDGSEDGTEGTNRFDDGEDDEGRSEIPAEDVSGIRLIFGSETFFATEVLNPPGGLIFRGNLRGEPSVTLSKLEERLVSRFGNKYTICLAEGDDDLKPVVVVIPSGRDKMPSSIRQKQFSLAAFLGCIIACICRVAFGMFGLDFLVSPQILLSEVFRFQVIPLALGIVATILLGTLLQRFVADHRKAKMSPPIMLPSYSLGTFGVISNVTSAAESRDVLFDISFFGAGTLLVFSMAMFITGLLISTSGASLLTVPSTMITDSLLLSFFTKKILGTELLRSAGKEFVGLHWLSVLGANCTVVAALNLLPIRQLDGGRMVAAIYGRKTAVLASRVTVFLLLMSTPHSSHLLFFLAFVVFGPWLVDRPARNELTEPGDMRALLGLTTLGVMMLVLLPKPSTMNIFG